MRASLTSILLAMMASGNTGRTILTAIGCMEGKFEVYGAECFPDRNDIKPVVDPSQTDEGTKSCIRKARAAFLENQGAGAARGAEVTAETRSEKARTLGCELLDRCAISAPKESLRITVDSAAQLFHAEAATTFLPDNSFSTFPLRQLNSLAEENLADLQDSLPPQRQNYNSTGLGLLRSAVADFLFNYKIAIQYPRNLGTYSLPHSAQELNAIQSAGDRIQPGCGGSEPDPAGRSQGGVPNRNSFFQLWRHNKSYIANGMITVRGISGLESLVDTDTQNAFDSTQAQTLSAVLSSLTGSSASTPAAGGGAPSFTCSGPSGGTPLCSIAALLKGSTSATGIATALAAITPPETHSIIGRQLTLDVIPHTLPGASSAELDVRLWAQEDSAPTIYSETGADNDYTSARSALSRRGFAWSRSSYSTFPRLPPWCNGRAQSCPSYRHSSRFR